MRFIKGSTFLSVLGFLLLMACQQEEAVSPVINSDVEFNPGKLATVNVAKDYEVNFWEIAPGDVVIDIYRSVEAEMNASAEIKTITAGNNFVEMYKMLAGKNADVQAIIRLEEAKLRSSELSLNAIKATKELFLKTSDDVQREAGRTAAVQAACSADRFNDGFGGRWFVETYMPSIPNSAGTDFVTNSGPYSSPIVTGPRTYWDIHVMNGEFSADNIVRVRLSGSFDGTVGPRKIRVFRMNSNRSGTFRGSLTNGLTCKTTHYGFLNLLN